MNLRRLFLLLYAVAATQLLMTQVVFGFGSDDTSSEEVNHAPHTDFVKGQELIEKEDWTSAIQTLSNVIKDEPKNADAFNYLGYANRQLGDYDKALEYYNRALEINPTHKGANEYIGEAYLQLGNLVKAEEHLSVLDDICTFGCAEYTMLKRAVSDYKRKHSS